MNASSFVNERQYQDLHIKNVISSVIRNTSTIGQLPTGGGKTVEFAKICNEFFKTSNKNILILVHRIELLKQARKKIKAICGINPELIVSGVKSVMYSRIYVGMVETVYNRAAYLDRLDIGLLIIDECHIANFNKIHEVFPNTYTIGFTATPIASNKKDPLKNYYNSIVCGPQIQWLIDNSYLSQNITRCPDDVINERNLTIDVKTGDFDIRSMAIEFSKPRYVANVGLFYSKWCRGKKTVIFNVNIEHSLEVTEFMNVCGYPCKHVDGETPMTEREEILKWFKETKNAVLCNVGIVNFGFDEPTIEAVIINLATLSLAKWIQCCGRGSRIIDENFIRDFQFEYPYELNFKSKFDIIDLGLNYVRFGDWNQDRDWERIFYRPDIPGEGVAPTKKCPSCKTLVHAAVHVCPICEYVFDKKKYEEQLLFANLVIVTQNISYATMVEEYKHRKDYFVFHEMGRMCVDKLLGLGSNYTHEQSEQVFGEYFKLVKKWYKAKFPSKAFDEAWHLDLAKNHFYSYLKEKSASVIKQSLQN